MYDAFNQLIDEGTNAYTYDALGRLTTANTNAFSYDDLTDNITSDGTQTFDSDPDGNLVALKTSNGTAGLTYNDHHDDLVATYTPNGTTLNGTASYTPWGQTTATINVTTDLGYQDDWTDPTSQLVNTAARWYDPATGTFTSRDSTNLDPTSTVQANRYTYADDQPLDATDRNGHSPEFHVGPSDCVEGILCRYAGAGGMNQSGASSGSEGSLGGDGGPDTGNPSGGSAGNTSGTTGASTGSTSGGGGQNGGAGDSGSTWGAGTDGSTGGGTGDDGWQAPPPPPPTAQQGLNEEPGDSRPTSNKNPNPNTDNKITQQDPTKPGNSKDDPLKVGAKANTRADGKSYTPSQGSTTNTQETSDETNSSDECAPDDVFDVLAGAESPCLPCGPGAAPNATFHWDSGSQHASITVTSGGRTVTTDAYPQYVEPPWGGLESLNVPRIVAAPAEGEGVFAKYFTLPNPEGALEYIDESFKTPPYMFGEWNKVDNSCITYCSDVLRNGGLDEYLPGEPGTSLLRGCIPPELYGRQGG
ncbi:hypothetical protein GXW82_44245 [Streptacidiphilus sp. 4-A2]|nr:hypothetical protein [Streptacidiphilus sp. 4-A2]